MTTRFGSTVLVVTLLLWGCQTLQHPNAPTVLSGPTVLAPSRAQTNAPSTTDPATPGDGPSQGCYYVWATRDLPELSTALRENLRQAGASLDGSAYAFGEECRADEGAVTFLAMQTDFRVRAHVDSLENEAAFGNAIRAAMTAIEALGDEQLSGRGPGRVEIEFMALDGQTLRLIIEVARFRQEAGDLEGSALFRLFQASP